MRVPIRLSRSCLTPIAAAVAQILATSAHAQQTDARDEGRESVDTIYVIDRVPDKASSSKFTAPLLDTPQTIAIIPQEVFNAQGARDLTDVLKNTPGISFSAGENGFATNTNSFSLRGFDTSGNIFIDGVRDSGNYGRDVFNLERVEVAKGPAADNGRGGAGGYVNLVTKSPQLDSFVRGNASYGFDEYDGSGRPGRGTLDVNSRLSDSSALRVNLMLQDGGIAGRQHADREAWGIAPSLAFGLDTSTRFTAALQHIDQSGVPDWGVPAAMIEGMMRFDPVAAEADRENFYGLLSDHDDNTSTTALFRIEHDFHADLFLSNQTRWTENDRDAVYTLPTGYDPLTQLVNTQRQAYDRKTTTLSNMTNFNLLFDTGDIRHSMAAGVELSREESRAARFGTDSSVGLTDIFSPDPERAPQAGLAAVEANSVDIDTAAVYVHDTMAFNDRWEVTGGLRVESYEVSIGSTDLITGLPTGPDGYEVSETTVSGKLGVVYKPAQQGSIYAAVGISALPPGSYMSNPDISRTGGNAFPGLVGQNNEAAKVQRAVNFEVGSKWNFMDERFQATVALFRTERRNVAISGKTPGDPASETVLQGYGRQIVEGIEASFSGSLTDAWTVFGGVLLMDSEREHSEFLDAARREASPGDYGDVLRTNGDQLAFTPRRSASLWTTYDLPFELTVGGGLQYVGDSYAGRPDDADRIIPNGTFGKLPDYTVVNLMASYPVTDKLLLRLNIDNVGDELYAVSTNWPTQRVFLGPPRSYLLSVDFRF